MGQTEAKGRHRAQRYGSLYASYFATAFLAMLALRTCSSPAFAAEQPEEFLRGLKDRGMNELALEYLDRMTMSRLVDEEFRKQIPYHRGVALIEQSRQSSDAAQRSRLLDEARAELEKFAQSNPENVQGAEAQ